MCSKSGVMDHKTDFLLYRLGKVSLHLQKFLLTLDLVLKMQSCLKVLNTAQIWCNSENGPSRNYEHFLGIFYHVDSSLMVMNLLLVQNPLICDEQIQIHQRFHLTLLVSLKKYKRR